MRPHVTAHALLAALLVAMDFRSARVPERQRTATRREVGEDGALFVGACEAGVPIVAQPFELRRRDPTSPYAVFVE